jgi:hypothetical protein
MGAGAEAGIFVAAPIHEIMPAFGARPGVVGDLVSRQAGGGANLLGDVVKVAGVIGVRSGQPAGCVQRREGSPRLNCELIERQVSGGVRKGVHQFGPPLRGRLPRSRINQIE